MSLIEQISALATRIAGEIKNIKNVFNLPHTTFADKVGVIQKNGVPFLHNFNYGNNGAVITEGNNLFLGEDAGNFTIGGAATEARHGSYNIGIGSNSLRNASKMMYSIAIGMDTLQVATDSNYCVAIGVDALKNSTTGSGNYAIGYQAMYLNTTGRYNAAYGTYALYSNLTGEENVSLGYKSMYSNNDSNNTTVGARSFYLLATGSGNVGFGNSCAKNMTSGSNNVLIGKDSATKVASGGNANIFNDSIFIGQDSRPNANSQTNQIAIGTGAVGNGSNTVQIGNTAITKIYSSGKLEHAPAVTDLESATLGQVKTNTNAAAPKVITGKSIAITGWTLVSGLYEYTIADANITINSIVNVIPDNADRLIENAASFLFRTDSSSGGVKIYAVNVPTATIGATLIITEKMI